MNLNLCAASLNITKETIAVVMGLATSFTIQTTSITTSTRLHTTDIAGETFNRRYFITHNKDIRRDASFITNKVIPSSIRAPCHTDVRAVALSIEDSGAD